MSVFDYPRPKGGQPRGAAGDRPLGLDDPRACWAVARGQVDIFLVETLADGRPGARHYLFSAGEGDLLLGLDTAASLLDVTLLAVGTPETVVEPIDRDRLLASRATVSPEALAALDRWVTALSASLSAPVSPRPRADLLLAAGEQSQLDKPRRISGAHGVVWCRGDVAGVLFIDMEAVEPNAPPVPLTHETWLSAPAKARVGGEDTAALRAGGELPAAIDAFHGLAVDLLPMALRLAAVDEINRLRARAAGDQRAAAQAIDALAGVFGQTFEHEAARDPDEPLLGAMTRLGQIQGFTLTLPRRLAESGAVLTPAEVARASGLRLREMTLEPNWWRACVTPFLLLREGEAAPLAIWPRALGGYWVREGGARVDRRLEPREAAGLSGKALVFYPPLPDRPLRVRDLLAGAVRRQGSDLAVLAGATLLAGVIGLCLPLATAYLLDTVIPDHDTGKLAEVAVGLFAVAAMTFVLRNAAQVASLRWEGLAGSRLQAAIMDRLLRLPAIFFRRFNTGELATRVLAVERLENALTAAMFGSIMSGGIALVSYGLMLAYSWRLGLLALGLTLGLAVVTFGLGLRRVRRENRAVDQDARVVGLSLELAGGVAKLRLAAAEDRAFLRWSRLYAEASRTRLEADAAAAQLSAVAAGYVGLATAAILAGCVYLRLAEGLSLGLLVAFLGAFNSALGGLASLASVVVDIIALAPISRHAAPILETAPEADIAKGDPGDLTGAIEISRLKFRYQADASPVFEDLSLKVRPGEFVAIVGPSGVGKSTLFRLLLGFEQPTSGLIQFDGLDLQGLDLQKVRRQCGVVLQGGKLAPGSLLDNILGGDALLTEADAWEVARQVGLEDDIRKMPMGLHTMVIDGGAFSGGQTQRLLLARALAGRPRILLLDEATSALDNRTQAIVTDNLNRLAATRVVVAHRLSTVRQADRIIVVNKGRVEEEGTYDSLMAAGGFFADLARRQLT